MKCVRAQCRQRCIEEGFEGGRCRKSRKTLKLGKKKCYCSEGAGESGSERGLDGGGGVWDGHGSGGQVRSGWAGRGSHARRNSGRHGGIGGDGGIGRGGYGGGRHDFTEGGGLNRGVPGRGGFSGQGVDDGDENYGSSDGGAP
uniref:Uncharacterized protein n=1 Tax=Kalanchoe fedtschenkoi TaxID=63787 RepID=A0A7N0ZYT0_KALFE